MDLLTAVAHELGHLLGYEHSDDGTMHDPGAPGATGERHTPTSSVVDPGAPGSKRHVRGANNDYRPYWNQSSWTWSCSTKRKHG